VKAEAIICSYPELDSWTGGRGQRLT